MNGITTSTTRIRISRVYFVFGQLNQFLANFYGHIIHIIILYTYRQKLYLVIMYDTHQITTWYDAIYISGIYQCST